MLSDAQVLSTAPGQTAERCPDAKDRVAEVDQIHRSHPRSIGWLGTTAMAMGGSNQSLFLIGALIAGSGQRRGAAAGRWA